MSIKKYDAYKAAGCLVYTLLGAAMLVSALIIAGCGISPERLVTEYNLKGQRVCNVDLPVVALDDVPLRGCPTGDSSLTKDSNPNEQEEGETKESVL